MALPIGVPDIRFARLSRSGGGAVVFLPKAFVELLGWHHRDALEIWIADGHIHLAAALSHKHAPAGQDAAADTPAAGRPEKV